MNSTDTSIEQLSHYKDANELLHKFCAAENNLINLSSEFLALLTTFSQQQQNNHLPDLYQYLLRGMRELHNQGLRADYPPRLMEKTCYVLCAAFDEEIMNSRWGQAACWENQTLVSGLFQQRNSGEFFFILMEQSLQNSSRMLDFIELQYLLLRLGFKGKYALKQEHKLVEITSHLFDAISKHRQPLTTDNEPEEHIPWQPLREWYPIKLIPIIVITLILSGALFHTWIRYENKDHTESLKPLLNSTHSLNHSTKQPL